MTFVFLIDITLRYYWIVNNVFQQHIQNLSNNISVEALKHIF